MPSDFDNSGDFRGSLNNQASRIGIQNNYFGTGPKKLDDQLVAASLALFDRMPIDSIPAPTICPGGSNIPFPPNSAFLGRDEELKRLVSTLKGNSAATLCHPVIISGMGGVGKTQLAAEFCHRYGQYFSGGVYWINFASDSNIEAELAECGFRFEKNGSMSADQLKEMVLLRWQGSVPCLVVFDNCESEELFHKWRPKTGAHRVIVTSRLNSWSETRGVKPVSLDVLSLEDSVELLRKYRNDVPKEDSILGEISEALGRLPLALHLAGSFLEQNRFEADGNPEGYLSALRQPDLLSHKSMEGGGYSPTNYDKSVAKSFALSIRHLSKRDDKGQLDLKMLHHCACFAPGEPIPRNLLNRTVNGNGDVLLSRLIDLGLLSTIGVSEDKIMMHRLVHNFVVFMLRHTEEYQETVESVVWWSARQSGYFDQQNIPAIVTHLSFIANNAERRSSILASNLLNSLGRYLSLIDNHDAAIEAYKRALEIDSKPNSGKSDKDIAVLIHNIGASYSRLEKLADAESYFREALKLDLRARDPNSRNVARDYNSLGNVLLAGGFLEDAGVCYSKAKEFFEESYGNDHFRVGEVTNNLARVQEKRGHWSEAQQEYEKALEIFEQNSIYPRENLAKIKTNIAVCLIRKSQFNDAITLLNESREIFEKTFGESSLNVATVLVNLSQALVSIGKIEDALQSMRRAREINAAILPNGHPSIKEDQLNLAKIEALIPKK